MKDVNKLKERPDFDELVDNGQGYINFLTLHNNEFILLSMLSNR